MKISEIAKSANTIGISGHIRPDGDCIGSCMGMYLFLKKVFPSKRIDVFLENIPAEFNIIKDVSEVRTDFKTDVDKYDLFIVLDSGKDRIGDAESLFDKAVHTVNIDHHLSNSGTGMDNYIVPTASSAAELVYNVIDKEYIDADIAQAIYIGIICDTGVFKYSNTSPETMRIGAELISYGFDFGKVIDGVFYEKTYIQNQILGRALLESILIMDGRCIVSMVNRQTMDFYEAMSSDLDGIVSQLMLTKGVNCAIFMHEMEPLSYKVSLRSDGMVNVAKVAEIFGGGGHARAAGLTINGTPHDVINSITLYLEQYLNGEKK
ncbi:MAG: bifunctional oligoribonuclease/PAP phosphatase NrnA [Butyrivibrio sp.]|nr:bifunctional oligoribonuclease/PAP phosphatase NrnA [Butyrivibrio sp.]